MLRLRSTELCPDGGYERWYVDDAEDLLVIEKVDDVQGLLDRNQALANDGDGYNKTRDFRRIGSIDMVTWEKWRKIYGQDLERNPAILKRLLNDPDHRKFRTAPGVA